MGSRAIFIFFISLVALGRDGPSVDFQSLKSIIEHDKLTEHVMKKKAKEKAKKEKVKKEEKNKSNFPREKDFFSFLSELWIVKNISVLKWDFPRPDHGIDLYFKNFLEKMGIINFRYKILIINTPLVAHFALPSNPSEAILLLSLPFVHALGLSNLDISLLLLEDLSRLDEGYFKKFLISEDFKKKFGQNFHKKKMDVSFLDELFKKYDHFVYEKGFTFKQQFKITKNMDRMLKGNSELWNRYVSLLKKIQELTQSDGPYKSYVKLYPSPQLQLEWLNPKK